MSGRSGVEVRDRASDCRGTGIFWRSINILGRGLVVWRCETVVDPPEAKEGKSAVEEISSGPRWSAVDAVSGFNLRQGDQVQIQTSAGEEAER